LLERVLPALAEGRVNDVTIVTPVLNGESYLRGCIESLKEAAMPEIAIEHLIIVGTAADG
jgi:glycosyltransferase involved in cell wall biosynthesis